MTDPDITDPIPLPSAAELELAKLEVRRAELLAQVEAERQARESASTSLRSLAIAIHASLCVASHDGTGENPCSWYSDTAANDPEAANWVEPAHLRWLGVAWAAVEVARGEGWTVEPPEPEENTDD